MGRQGGGARRTDLCLCDRLPDLIEALGGHRDQGLGGLALEIDHTHLHGEGRALCDTLVGDAKGKAKLGGIDRDRRTCLYLVLLAVDNRCC